MDHLHGIGPGRHVRHGDVDRSECGSGLVRGVVRARGRAFERGAGRAGAATAAALARHGWRSTLLERGEAPALEGSGNPAGLFHGTVNPDDGPHARPRHGVMPAWDQRLDPVTIKMLAAYVHSLGGGE